MRTTVVVLVILLFSVTAVYAENINVVYNFDEPVITDTQDGTVSISIRNTWNRSIASWPVLPVRTARVLLPQGHQVVNIKVEVPYWLELANGATVEHGKRTRTLSGRDPGAWLPSSLPDTTIYNSDDPYPDQLWQVMGTYAKRGASIFIANLHPVIYLPQSGQLYYAPEMELVVETAPAEFDTETLPFRNLPADHRAIMQSVDNPQMLKHYVRQTKATTDSIDYLIVTPVNLETAVQSFADHKASYYGLSVQIDTLAWIWANVAGADAQEKLRNHITNLYETANLKYVLLVGDADGPDEEIIPMRKLYVTGTDPDTWYTYTDEYMASDLYYACLDGSYNYDGDAYWGETDDGPLGGDVDLLFDVHVGRFPVETVAELNNMIDKTIAFETSASSYKALFIGEMLDSVTWGGDNKDEVYSYMPAVPLTTLFERDGTYSKTNIINAINSNTHQWLNHLGHAAVTINMGFSSGSVSSLTNTKYYVGYTQGCYCGSIDSRDDYGSFGSTDCVIEWFTAKHNAGAFAYLANTRYGFYLEGSVYGPSNVFDWEFADAIFNEKIINLGIANDDSKEDCIGMLDPFNMMRWVFYELLLFGDPHTPLQFQPVESSDGEIEIDDVYGCTDIIEVEVTDADLSDSTITVFISSTTETTPETVTLYKATYFGHYKGTITNETGSPTTDGVLQVNAGDEITVEYVDADDGQGGTFVSKYDVADVDCEPPLFGGLVSAIPGDSQVTLSWNPALDDAAVTYNIYRADVSGGQNFTNPTFSTTALEFTDHTVTNFTPYYYVVRAQDAFGQEETNSIEIAATPIGPVVIWEETWDSKWDHEWEIINGEGPETWNDENPCNRSSGLMDGNFIVVDSDCAGYENMNEHLISEVIDVSGYQMISLRFSQFHVNYQGENADVDVWLDGGEVMNVAAYTDDIEEITTIDLSEYEFDTIRLRFHYYNAYWDFYWLLDNIQVLGYLPLCETNEDCDDNLFCNGTETCDEGICISSLPPCADDGLFCNGVESCDEEDDECEQLSVPDCSDDSLFCNGDEYCNEGADQCDSTGNPCDPDTQICNEVTDVCDEQTDDDSIDDDTTDDDTTDDDTVDDDIADDDVTDDDVADDDVADDDVTDDDSDGDDDNTTGDDDDDDDNDDDGCGC